MIKVHCLSNLCICEDCFSFETFKITRCSIILTTNSQVCHNIFVWLTHLMLCLTPSLSSISPHDTFQGYVTVSEINELYSQLRGEPKPTPRPTLANASPESETNPSPDGDKPKPPEDEVCLYSGVKGLHV